MRSQARAGPSTSNHLRALSFIGFSSHLHYPCTNFANFYFFLRYFAVFSFSRFYSRDVICFLLVFAPFKSETYC